MSCDQDDIVLLLSAQDVLTHFIYFVIWYYINWAKTSWAYSRPSTTTKIFSTTKKNKNLDTCIEIQLLSQAGHGTVQINILGQQILPEQNN